MEMDDFDFKPITQGLGFDKKAEEVKAKPITATPSFTMAEATQEIIKPQIFEKSIDWNTSTPKASRVISDMINSLPPSLDFTPSKNQETKTHKQEAKVQMPVGRMDYVSPQVKGEVPTTTFEDLGIGTEAKVDVSLNNTLEKAFPKVGFRRPFFHQTVEVKPQFTMVSANFTSAVLDTLVIGGIAALFLVSLIFVTKIDLIAVLLHTRAPLSVWLDVGMIFMGVYLLYYTCTRGFWGSTLGDWAFDTQLGLEDDRTNRTYTLRVAGRMLAIAATGFVTLPLISFLLKKDIAYWITGLRLYTKNY